MAILRLCLPFFEKQEWRIQISNLWRSEKQWRLRQSACNLKIRLCDILDSDNLRAKYTREPMSAIGPLFFQFQVTYHNLAKILLKKWLQSKFQTLSAQFLHRFGGASMCFPLTINDVIYSCKQTRHRFVGQRWLLFSTATLKIIHVVFVLFSKISAWQFQKVCQTL